MLLGGRGLGTVTMPNLQSSAGFGYLLVWVCLLVLVVVN